MLVDQQQPTHEVRLKLDASHHGVAVVHGLRERHVEHRPRRLVEGKPGKLRIALRRQRCDRCRAFSGDVETEVLIRAGPRRSLKNRRTNALVHHGDGLGRLVVGSCRSDGRGPASRRGSEDSWRSLDPTTQPGPALPASAVDGRPPAPARPSCRSAGCRARALNPERQASRFNRASTSR